MIATVLTATAVLLRIVSNPLANVFQKTLTARGQHPLRVNFLTYFVLSLCCVPVAVAVDWSVLPPVFWAWAALEGALGAAGNGLLVKALQKGDLSVLGPINAYKSVVGMIVGIALLQEWPNGWGLLGAALIIGGSYVVLDTTEERFSPALFRKPEIQYRLWAMVLTAIEAVVIKKVILLSSAATAFVTWCVFGALFSFLLLPVLKVPRRNESTVSRADAKTYALLVACIGIMQLTTNFVFDRMPVGYALALFQLSALVSVVLGWRMFGEADVRKKLVGAGVMVVGGAVIVMGR